MQKKDEKGLILTNVNLKTQPDAPFLVLSFFDSLIGPMPFKIYPEREKSSLKSEALQNIASHMDVHQEEDLFQINYGNENFNALNLIFSIPSDWARGMREMCMISIIDTGNNDLIETYRMYLYQFKQMLTKIPDAFKGFYVKNLSKLRTHPEIADVYQTIDSLIEDFYEKLPQIKVYRKTIELSLFGLPKAGKRSLLNQIPLHLLAGNNNSYEKMKLLELTLRTSRFLLFTLQDSFSSNDIEEICAKSDGILFLIDGSDAEKIPRARQILFEIIRLPLLKSVPISVLLNKTDLKTCIKKQDFEKMLNSAHSTHSLLKIFEISAKTGDGLTAAIDWIFSEITKLDEKKEMVKEGCHHTE